MPMVTLSWNNMLRAPRILVGAISDRKTGTACYTVDHIYEISMPMVTIIIIIIGKRKST